MSKLGWKNLARRAIRWDGAPWVTMIVLALVAGVALSWIYWGDLHRSEDSLSTTIRNVALVIGGVIAVLLAVWRSRVAERQAATAQQGLLNERYQKGAEMLGSHVLAVRLGGIYALRRLAKEYPEQYHIQVMSLLCAFVRLPSPNNGIESYPQMHEGRSEQTLALRADVQDAMQAIALRSSAGISMESSQKDFKLYLRDAHISGLQLRNANLSKAWLTNANLSGAVLPYVDLSSARLRLANLSGAELRNSDLSNAAFWGANLSGAALWKANLSGSDFCGAGARSSSYRTPACGLTQAQLDQALADTDNPPKLNGVLDAETGEPLVWRGKPINTDR